MGSAAVLLAGLGVLLPLTGCDGGGRGSVETKPHLDAVAQTRAAFADEVSAEYRADVGTRGDYKASDVACTIIGQMKFAGKLHDAYRCRIVNIKFVLPPTPAELAARCVLYIAGTIYDVTPRKREIETTGGRPPRCP